MENIELFTKFMNTLYEASRTIQEYESTPRNYGTDMNLYMNEVHTLAIVYKNEGITVSEIVEIEKKTQSAISQKINKLVKKGLIRKERNPVEYKKLNLYTTETGKKVCQYHAKLDEKNYQNAMHNPENQVCIDEDYEKFIGILNGLISGMKRDMEGKLDD